jgi:hypothetical protein
MAQEDSMRQRIAVIVAFLATLGGVFGGSATAAQAAVKRIRMLAMLAALGLVVSMLGLAAAVPAGAATASRHARSSLHTPITTFAATRASTDPFSLANFSKPSMCLGINSSRYAGLYNCTYKNDQAWTWGHAYGVSSYRQLINAKDQCLGVAGASTNPGARVVGWTCLPTHRDQYWIEAGECLVGFDFFYLFQNDQSQLVLGVAAGSTSNGAEVVQWTDQHVCNNQYWGLAY